MDCPCSVPIIFLLPSTVLLFIIIMSSKWTKHNSLVNYPMNWKCNERGKIMLLLIFKRIGRFACAAICFLNRLTSTYALLLVSSTGTWLCCHYFYRTQLFSSVDMEAVAPSVPFSATHGYPTTLSFPSNPHGFLTVPLYNGCALFALQSLFKAVNRNTSALRLSQTLLAANRHTVALAAITDKAALH